MEPLDKESIAITNPVQAEKYYLPKVIAKEMDLTAVKKELRELHPFSEEDVRISAHVISNAEFKFKEKNPEGYMKWAPLTVSLILIVGGIAMFYMMSELGFFLVIPALASFGGVGLLFNAVSKLRS